MPLYEYKCASCGKTFEVIQKFSDEPLQTHAECGGKVERLISAPAFHLKGTGWYATDYAKSNGSDNKAKDGKSDGAKTGAAEGSDKSSGSDKLSGSDKSSETKKTESSSSASDTKSAGSSDKQSSSDKPSSKPSNAA